MLDQTPVQIAWVTGDLAATEATLTALRTMRGLVGFLGATVIAFLNVLRHPRRFRFNATVQRFEVVGVSALAALVASTFGFLVAWVLTRYRFPGRKLVDAAVDLPFALPTAVAGIALTAIFDKNGWIGKPLDLLGIQVAYTWLGVVVALTFIGLPFVVRTLQPVIVELDREIEEAAATLGAARFQAIVKVILPSLLPALLTGFVLALARGVGEYGSVVFIAGNIPYKTEIAPLLIVIRLTEFDYSGATAIATVMLALSFLMFLTINIIQAWARRRFGHV